MTVDVERTSTHTFATGVRLSTYDVKVSGGGKSQTASVQRLVMPKGSKPQLLHTQLGRTGTLPTQVKGQANRAAAAVNGDFFYQYETGQGRIVLPRGVSVTRRHVVRADDEDMRVVGVDTAGRPYSGMLHVGGQVTRESDPSRVAVPITGVNWHWLGSSGAVVYTNDWADGDAAPRPLAAVEWVVSDGRIVQVRTGNERGQDVKPGTRVIGFGSDHTATAKRADRGDAVSVDIRQVTSSGVTLREGVGRGATLVRDHEVAIACDAPSTERRPRTTVGWLGTGRWATLTVLGSGYDNHGYRVGGLGLPQTANVAQVLGFTGNDELDGGGSVASYVRRTSRWAGSRWDRVDDLDSRWVRSIPNGLAFSPR